MYTTNLEDYHAVSVVPELIYSIIVLAVDLKLGIPVGISDDAYNYGVRLSLTARF